MDPKIKKMISVMSEKESRRRGRRKKEKWFVYVLQCKDGSFYTGITNDLEKRVETHQAGKGAKYTRCRLPVKLLYSENCVGRTSALVRECAVKAYSRKEKEKLVAV